MYIVFVPKCARMCHTELLNLKEKNKKYTSNNQDKKTKTKRYKARLSCFEILSITCQEIRESKSLSIITSRYRAFFIATELTKGLLAAFGVLSISFVIK